MADFIDKLSKGMLVGIIDADLIDGGTRHPNLALMKISGYCKSIGCDVDLLDDYEQIPDYEIVFISCVFTFTHKPDNLQDMPNVYCGGTGFYTDGGKNLPDAIEHHMPDYNLYKEYVDRKIAEGRSRSWYADYLDYSIGFTTRGCFRKCSFCVNKKYDHAFRHSPVSEFLDVSRPYIYLWDDNILAYSKWEEVIDELIATGKPFQFRQGIDIRLLNDRKAKKLAGVRYCGDFIFAFDHIEDRPIIERGLTYWRKYTVRGTRLYVLCAFDSQDERDIENTFERIRILMHYGCLPYIMRYESYKQSRWRSLYVTIARWCNQPQFFKKKSFREFCEANQDYHRNKNTKCAALQAMDDFEEAFPQIAAKYFDLKYEELNVLIRHGRRFFGRPTKEVEESQSTAWTNFRNGSLSSTEALTLYLDKDLDIVWAREYGNDDYSDNARQLFECIRNASLSEIYSCILDSDFEEPITPENIPQFSSLDDVCKCTYPLNMVGADGLVTYDELGIYLCPDKRKAPAANKKYGENHGKTACLLDLGYIERSANRTGFHSTYFGAYFDKLDNDAKSDMIARLAFRIPIIRKVLRNARETEVVLGDYMHSLARTTKVRRRPNVTKLLDLIEERATLQDEELLIALSNVRTGI